jgi:TolB-like protein
MSLAHKDPVTNQADAETAGLWSKLRRRKVVQWGVAYIAATWGFLQGLAYMCATFGWPQSLQQTATVALLAGLPIALVLAWYHGDRGAQRVSGIELAILTALLLLGGGMFAWLSGTGRTPQRAEVAEAALATAGAGEEVARDKSIAVLPFVNRSAREDDAYFADGMHDDLLGQLAKIGDVRVISRTSVMRYANTEKPIAQIAAELNVGTILEGGVQRAGNRVRINAQLIDARTDAHLWSETFDRELTVENLFDIQSEITQAIATSLRSVLSGSAVQAAQQLPTRNTAAYQAYLLGNTLNRYESREAVMIERAVRAYADAVELDPEFAAAHARKAIAHLTLVWWNVDEAENLRQAEAALARARALAPDAVETRIADGYYRYWGQLDYAGAYEALKKVLETSPQNAALLSLTAAAARRSGDMAAAIAAYERAHALDPQESGVAANLTVTNAYLGRRAEARRWIERAWTLAPTSLYNANAELAVLDMDADPEATWRRYEQLRRQPGLVPAQVDREFLQNYFADSLRDPTRIALVVDRLADPEALEAGDLNQIQLGFTRAELLDRIGRHDEAREQAQRVKAALAAIDPAPRGRESAAVLAIQIDAFLGNTEAAQAAAARMIRNPPSDHLWTVETARGLTRACARLGDEDCVFDLVERAVDRFSPSHFANVITGTAFDGMRGLPRYKVLQARYEAWRASQP